jgi:hypothetical protein
MAPLQDHAEVERRDQLTKTEGPVRAREASASGTNDRAEDHQQVRDEREAGKRPRQGACAVRHSGSLATDPDGCSSERGFYGYGQGHATPSMSMDRQKPPLKRLFGGCQFEPVSALSTFDRRLTIKTTAPAMPKVAESPNQVRAYSR